MLFEEGRELSLGEAILRLIKALKEARAKAENISKGTQPAHRPRHQSGPHAYLDVDPELANTLPYLTRHTIHGMTTHYTHITAHHTPSLFLLLIVLCWPVPSRCGCELEWQQQW